MDAHATPPEPTTPATEARVIPVLDERLRVSRRSRETGRATRVRKRVRERLETLDLATQREAVHVERVPFDRPVAGPLASREEGDVLVIPVVEQRLVVRTEWVLREEIRITRRRHVEHERRTVQLRTEVAIVGRSMRQLQQRARSVECNSSNAIPLNRSCSRRSALPPESRGSCGADGSSPASAGACGSALHRPGSGGR